MIMGRFKRKGGFTTFVSSVVILSSLIGGILGIGFYKGPKTEEDFMETCEDIHRYIEANKNNDIEIIIKGAEKIGKKHNLNIVYKPIREGYHISIYLPLDNRIIKLTDFDVIVDK